MESNGLFYTDWKEWIGDAAPPKAAKAIAETISRTLLAAWSGETFILPSEPIWVGPMAVALGVDRPDDLEGNENAFPSPHPTNPL
jgi:hypothetical protein